tara:strand:- start:651 stop:1136 length:486 start_codon:yes stop_codon:yes gene_type:complete
LRAHLKIFPGALCDAFLDVLPLVVIMASIALFTAITKFFVPDQNWFWLQKLILVHDILGRIFPWLICVSIAYHFAKPHSVRATHAIVSSAATFIIVQVFTHQELGFEVGSWASQYNINIILNPLFVVICLRCILTPLKLNERTISLDSNTLAATRSLLPVV